MGLAKLSIYAWFFASSPRVFQSSTGVDSVLVTSDAFTVHNVGGSSRGKPVVISILACSLGFHAITFERSSYTEISSFKIKPV